MRAHLERIKQHFEAHSQAIERCQHQLADTVAEASRRLHQTLLQQNKILVCGNGGSAADAQHFAAELINRFEHERRSWPALALTTDSSALTAIANDYAFEQVFSKQVEGLGQAGDALIVISTSGRSANILKAVSQAHHQGLWVLALTGKDGGLLADQLQPKDIELRIPEMRTAHIQECHLTLLHLLCDSIDFLSQQA